MSRIFALSAVLFFGAAAKMLCFGASGGASALDHLVQRAETIHRTPYQNDQLHLQAVQPLLDELLESVKSGDAHNAKQAESAFWHLLFQEKNAARTPHLDPAMSTWVKRLLRNGKRRKAQRKLFEIVTKSRTEESAALLKSLVEDQDLQKSLTPDKSKRLADSYFATQADLVANGYHSGKAPLSTVVSELRRLAVIDLERGSRWALDRLLKLHAAEALEALKELSSRADTPQWLYSRLVWFEVELAKKESLSENNAIRKQGFERINSLLRRWQLRHWGRADNSEELISRFQEIIHTHAIDNAQASLLHHLQTEGGEEARAVLHGLSQDAPLLHIRAEAEALLEKAPEYLRPDSDIYQPAVKIINRTDGQVQVQVLSGAEKLEELAKIDWGRVTFVLEPHGTKHLDWLRAHVGFVSLETKPVKIEPDSKTHQLIADEIELKAKKRAIRTSGWDVPCALLFVPTFE